MSYKYPPECPFCGRYIIPPETTMTEFGEVLSGKCICGVVYVCDPTGHNTGEAYMEALALMKGDWNIHLLDSDADYQTADIEYDLKTHQRIYSKGQNSICGKLIFVRQKVSGAEEAALSASSMTTAANTQITVEDSRMKIKDRIRNLLKLKSYSDIVDMAQKDKSIIRAIISLAYDKEDVITWRAVEAMGLIANKFSTLQEKGRLEIIRDTIRRLLWSMGEESGGIGWSAAEMLGEIIRSSPDEFSDIIPILWSFKEEEMFRAGAVWAMGQIAMVRPDLVQFISGDLKAMLMDKNPAVRGYAARVSGILSNRNFMEDIKGLQNDSNTIIFYQNGELQKRTVGEIANEAIKKLDNLDNKDAK